MMAMPATMPSSAEQACISAPIALALAPNAMNTVENPATNSSAANTVSPAHRRLGFGLGKPFQRGSGEINGIGRHQRQHAGRQKAQHAREQGGNDRDVGSHPHLDVMRLDAPTARGAQGASARCDEDVIGRDLGSGTSRTWRSPAIQAFT